LAALTRKERARGNTKLQVALSRAHQVACSRRLPAWSAWTFLDGDPNCAIAKVSAASSSVPVIAKGVARMRARCQAPRSNPVWGWQGGLLRRYARRIDREVL